MAPKDVHDALDQWHDGLLALSEFLIIMLAHLGNIEEQPFSDKGEYRKRHN